MGYDSWSKGVYNAAVDQAGMKKLLQNGGFGGSASTPEVNVNISYSLYTNQRLGFEIEFPSEWKVEEAQQGTYFLSPLENSMDKFREGVTVMVLPATNRPLQETANFLLNSLKQQYRIVGTYTEPGIVGQYPALGMHMMVIGNPNQENRFSFAEAEGKLIIIEYDAYDYKGYLPIADKMSSSFRLI